MKTIVSSKALQELLRSVLGEHSEVSHYRLIKDGMEFLKPDGEVVHYFCCETLFYRMNDERYGIKQQLNKKRWEDLRKALFFYFPEQPIVMELDDDCIEITQCVLRF